MQTLKTQKPTFCLTSSWRITPEAEAALEKRCVLSATLEELREDLQRYLDDGKFAADATDTEFLHAYGTTSGDGRSWLRAYHCIHEVAFGDAGSSVTENSEELESSI